MQLLHFSPYFFYFFETLKKNHRKLHLPALRRPTSSWTTMTTELELPCDLWEKISYTLADHPPSLCILSKTSPKLRELVRFVIGHYEAHLHVTFPKDECPCKAEKSSTDKVHFEMILNRKGRFRRGKAHCHSIFTCTKSRLELAIDDLLELFADELLTLRFNNFPEDSHAFTVFNKYSLPKCEDICFNGSLPMHNGVYDLFESCRNTKRLVISNPAESTDFTRFWPMLKGSRVENLDLMVIASFRHSSTREFKLPPSLKQLFFCPKQEVECKHTENLATLMYSGNWRKVYIHSESALHSINSSLYKPIKTITEFCYSSKSFTVDYVMRFLKKCENVNYFNWFGLHSCVAPIVIARLLVDVPRNIVFSGCVPCKSGETVGNGGFMEVGNRVPVVQVSKLLEREEFRAQFGKTLADAVLFERSFKSGSVMYLQKKDSRKGMSLPLLSKSHINILRPALVQITKRPLSSRSFTHILRIRPPFSPIRLRLVRNISNSNSLPKMTENGKNIVLKRYDSIVKGAQDTREYRGLELTNGLRILLVSDPTTDKSAASIDVKVGHLMDPWELPGLAHFCEHMLFLGTAKYPSENEYSKFLSAHAGSSNAFTSTDHTNYHFDVKPEELPGALDRFVQFFLAPQFTESATEREVCAVDSEHSNNLNNDMWRFVQVDRSRSKPGHDYGKFGTGNKQTLLVDARKNGIEPRDALLNFHKKWYSSDIMSCCIIGKEPLDDLERYLGTFEFDAIENKKVSRKTWSEHPYGPEQLGKKVEAVPIKDTRMLTITFPFPDLNGDYQSQPGHYITHLLGHEGSGSLLSELKRLGWVSSLQAGNHTQAAGFGVFDVSMDLSTEGLDHVEDIVQLVFNYIGLLQSTGPQKWVFEELAELSSVKFLFKDKETPINMATNVASSLQYIPFDDILSSKYLLTKYDPDQIKQLLATLTPKNMSYRVVSQKFKGQDGNTTEPVYGTEIRVTDIDKDVMNKFEKALKTNNPALRLPEKNEYIATKFEQKPREAMKSEHPRLINDDGWSRVWFKQDDEYKMPKQETKLALTTPIVAQNPRNSLLSSLWLWCLSDTLAEETYNADLAGLKCQLESSPFGVQLRVYGYDEKQALFVKHLTNRMTNFKIDKTRFDVLFESLKRALTNHAFSQPYTLTQHYTQLLVLDKVWSKEQLLAVCDSVTLEDVQGFAKEMLESFYLELFVHGNSTEKEALQLSKDITNILKSVNPKCRPLYWNEHSPRREIQLNDGDEFVYRHLQKTHDVGCVEVMYQIGVQNTRDNALVGLIDQLIREPAFNTLRTTESLGYIVWTGSRLSAGTVALNVIVQGPKSVDHVLERIEAFLESVRKEIVDMPADEFNKQVAAMITRLEEKPKTLSSRFRRFWNEIECRQYNFSRRENEVEVLKKIKKEDILDLFDKKIRKNAAERRKLAVFVHGKNEDKVVVDETIKKNSEMGKKEKEVQHVQQLRQYLPFYGRPMPSIELKPIGMDPLQSQAEPTPASKY
ncbi:unnamed protein product [Caenorhabditis sp. 36 PRJEB53466]|nr:unnamed protein product [Caenorhabditis sp. 36 PRJEB53466]